MQVEAIYNQGRIEFVHPIKLKHDHLRLVVLVPDEEVEPAEQPAGPLTMRERVNAILAPYQHLLTKSEPATAADHKAVWREHLEEKYLPPHEKSDT